MCFCIDKYYIVSQREPQMRGNSNMHPILVSHPLTQRVNKLLEADAFVKSGVMRRAVADKVRHSHLDCH